MNVPKSVEEYTQMMNTMQNDIDNGKLIIEETGQKRLTVEQSLNEVTMLRDKANHIIQNNEEKTKQLTAKMQEIKQTYLSCKAGLSSAITDNTPDVFQATIIQLKITKSRLKNDLNNLEEPMKNTDKVNRYF